MTLRVVKAWRGKTTEMTLNFRFGQFRFEEFNTPLALPSTTNNQRKIKGLKNTKKPDPFIDP